MTVHAQTTDAGLAALGAALGEALVGDGRMLATAESCTGGWIAKVLTDKPGSSAWFAGGVVCYADAVKTGVLGVPADILAAHGAVSEATVEAMARGARELCAADIAVAVSGITGPGGEVAGKSVGTVCFGWAWRAEDSIRTQSLTRHFGGDRETVRRESVAQALRGALEILRPAAGTA